MAYGAASDREKRRNITILRAPAASFRSVSVCLSDSRGHFGIRDAHTSKCLGDRWMDKRPTARDLHHAQHVCGAWVPEDDRSTMMDT